MVTETQSPIELELLEATGQKVRGKKEDINDFLVRLCTAVSELEDDDYEALSEPAKGWFAQATEAINNEAFDDVKPFADFEETEKPKAKKPAAKKPAAKEADDEGDDEDDKPTSKKTTTKAKPAAKKPAKEEFEPEEGSYVKVTDADGDEVEGEVTTLTEKKITVTDSEGEEHTFFLSKVEVEEAEKPAPKGKKAAAKKEEPAEEEVEAGEEGSYVKITDADGDEVEGEVTANNGKKITVTDADGEEHTFFLSKVEVEAAEKPKAKKAAAKAKPAKEADDEGDDDDKPAKGKGSAKPPKDVPKDAPKSASGSDLFRALICENFADMNKDAIFKLARKKGVEISDTQLNTVYATTIRTIELLQELGKIAE